MSLHPRHSRSHHRWVPLLALVAVLLLMAAAAASLGWVVARDSVTPAQRDAPAPTNNPTPDSAAGQAPDAAALQERCRSRWAAQVHDELAADASLDQWRLHIDAMNQLVAGEITLEQATDYWQRTRLGAHRKVDRFHSQDEQLAQSSARCEKPDDRTLTADQRRWLSACRAATHAFAESLAAARVAIATWERHITDMDALRDGDITAQQATAMWLQSWRTGARQLHTYDRRAAVALRHECT